MGPYLKTVNNTLSNIGNKSSVVNYGAWGSSPVISPLSGYKTTEYEGGTRVPFVIKEPKAFSSEGDSNKSSIANPKLFKAFAFVNDITPTILDYAGIQHPGTTYNGHLVHPIMGKSLKPLLNGTIDRVYGENEIVADEMFNNTAVYMGDWKATNHPQPIGDGKWQLHNIVNDPGQNHDLASQHPDILQKMISGYETYAKNVGVVVPRGEEYSIALAISTPPLNQSEVTITSKDISPAEFSNKSIDGTIISKFLTGKNMSQYPALQKILGALQS